MEKFISQKKNLSTAALHKVKEEPKTPRRRLMTMSIKNRVATCVKKLHEAIESYESLNDLDHKQNITIDPTQFILIFDNGRNSHVAGYGYLFHNFLQTQSLAHYTGRGTIPVDENDANFKHSLLQVMRCPDMKRPKKPRLNKKHQDNGAESTSMPALMPVDSSTESETETDRNDAQGKITILQEQNLKDNTGPCMRPNTQKNSDVASGHTTTHGRLQNQDKKMRTAPCSFTLSKLDSRSKSNVHYAQQKDLNTNICTVDTRTTTEEGQHVCIEAEVACTVNEQVTAKNITEHISPLSVQAELQCNYNEHDLSFYHNLAASICSQINGDTTLDSLEIQLANNNHDQFIDVSYSC